mmetsp:Transcript_10747/g.23465  ORF Transcript_10747/g.23465 Transcript_10747/m.23465 type:complete len:440 (+) Transcript_10747:155-1474(+)
MAWEVAWDRQRKRWYYQDRFRSLSSWDKPDDCSLDLPTDPPEGWDDADGPAAKLPPYWESSYDVQEKRWYYFNKKTLERRWENPTRGRHTATGKSVASYRQPTQVPEHDSGEGDEPEGIQTPPLTEPDMSSTKTQPVVAWNAGDVMRNLAAAKKAKEPITVRDILKTVAEHNQKLRTSWRVPRTQAMPFEMCQQRRTLGKKSTVTKVTMSNRTVAAAMEAFSNEEDGEGTVCGLNCATGLDPCPGYKRGVHGEEEDLCRRIPDFALSLQNAKRVGLYPFGPPTCTDLEEPARYSDVLFTPDMVVARGCEEKGYPVLDAEEQVKVALVSAVAPNVTDSPESEIFDKDRVYNSIRNIIITPKTFSPDVTTLVLGAFGWKGGCKAEDMAELFAKALKDESLAGLYSEIHFAIPGVFGDQTYSKVFREIFRRQGIDVEVVGPT